MSQETSSPVGNPINLLSVFFILFGAYLFIPSFQYIRLAESSLTWPVVEGRIISSEIEKKWSDRENTFDQGYWARIWYAYKVNDTEVLNCSLTLRDDYVKNPLLVKQQVQKYVVGESLSVRYNPEDPLVSVIEKEKIPPFEFSRIGLGLMLIFAGLLAVWSVFATGAKR